MKSEYIQQIAIISDPDPRQLQEKINVELLKHRMIDDISIVGEQCLIRYKIERLNADPDPGLIVSGTPVVPDYRISFLKPDFTGETKRICIEIVVPDRKDDRHCCECENYDWGKGCPYREGRVRIMDEACDMFNIIIKAE